MMRDHVYLLTMLVFTVVLSAAMAAGAEPLVGKDVVFEERDGAVAVEAEHFFEQPLDEPRAWYVTTVEATPDVQPDGDENHAEGASGGAYVEALPDTRRTHDDRLVHGENFSNEPGVLATLHYRVHFRTPGRYYVWGRIYSTGTEDNGLHVGIDGEWPASGQRMQWTKKNEWAWGSKQRTEEVHTGVPHQLYLDVEEPGEHVISFSMREDGTEFDKWLMTTDRDFTPEGDGPPTTVRLREAARPALVEPREPHGDASVTVSEQPTQWGKVTLTLDGPFAHEMDQQPNPFTDYRMQVRFRHVSGLTYDVPGYFAADGDAANTSAESGTRWRAHLSPNLPGRWNYQVSFWRGAMAAVDESVPPEALPPYHGVGGHFDVAPMAEDAPGFRGKGRLAYVGKRYLRFDGSGEYFLKAGADSPETLLGYVGFDGTQAGNVPLKDWGPHVQDWREGDPTWQDGKGKGLIGALNYLSSKGANSFSFLTYNAGGDGDNVWPFVERDDPLHYDCSKLDQWGMVFDHAQDKGLYLHFKTQETENDNEPPTALDDGELGPERKLYYRELVARFGHNLALNWNLGEENTQTTEQRQAMAAYLRAVDPHDHHIVIHTYPGEHEKVYAPLLGEASELTGMSLQTRPERVHRQTLEWVARSAEAGKPWVIANDEQGPANVGVPADATYLEDAQDLPDVTGLADAIRKQVLWGNLMAGGGGVEYYFGYKLPENDLLAEDFRSREQSWAYARHALAVFDEQDIPFWKMSNANSLIGNTDNVGERYCFAKPGELYLIYLGDGGKADLDLTGVDGEFSVNWYNPRDGGELMRGSVERVEGGGAVSVGLAPADQEQDWLVVLRRD